MLVCLAGKSNALKEAIDHTLTVLPKSNLLILPSESDPEEDNWQYSIKNYAKEKGLKVVKLEDLYPLEDLVFISIQFDRIIVPKKFRTPLLFNIHFSYLPAYKGVSPHIWAILNGESFTGVTLHYIDRGIDTGDIIDQVKFPILLSDTSFDLYQKSLHHANILLKKNFWSLITGKVKSSVQPWLGASYYSKRSIDFSNIEPDLRQTAFKIHNHIRAYTFRPYQLPSILGYKIVRSEILPQKSSHPPGKVIEETDQYLTISTIDFNIQLIKDYFEDLERYCLEGHTEKAKKVIPLTDDLEERNAKGWTPLMIASYNENMTLVEELVNQGANVNARNFKGTTVLMYAKSAAAQSGRTDILELLITHGAVPHVKDNKGKSLMEYAREEGNPKVISYLEKQLAQYE